MISWLLSWYHDIMIFHWRGLSFRLLPDKFHGGLLLNFFLQNHHHLRDNYFHQHEYCQPNCIMLFHRRSQSFGLTRWTSWRTSPSRPPVWKVFKIDKNKTSLKPQIQIIFVISALTMIGLTEYFFKPYYRCSATITGTIVIVNWLLS